MRQMYKKSTARSDEQAFHMHLRQPMLISEGKGSSIEEEAKSNSNLNLSTTSRSYKPGIIIPKSNVYSQHSGNSVSSNPNFGQHYQSTVPQNTSTQYFYPGQNHGMTMPAPSYRIPEQVHKPFPPQYKYSMGHIPQHPMYPTNQNFAPPMSVMKPSPPMFMKPAGIPEKSPLR
jgi:hypothetical protein